MEPERRTYVPKKVKSKAQRRTEVLYAIGLTVVLVLIIAAVIGTAFVLGHFIIKYW